MSRLFQTLAWLPVQLFFERPVRHKSSAELSAMLARAGTTLEQALTKVTESPQSHALITHIIGIERWAQARLKVGLGSPMPHDEYNGYRPAKTTPWQDLRPLFQQARAESVALVAQLSEADLQRVILHNQWGNLSLRGWAYYIQQHAAIEMRKLV